MGNLYQKIPQLVWTGHYEKKYFVTKPILQNLRPLGMCKRQTAILTAIAVKFIKAIKMRFFFCFFLTAVVGQLCQLPTFKSEKLDPTESLKLSIIFSSVFSVKLISEAHVPLPEA